MGRRVMELKVIIIINVVFGLFSNSELCASHRITSPHRATNVIELLMRCSLLLGTTLSTLSEPKFDTIVPDRLRATGHRRTFAKPARERS